MTLNLRQNSHPTFEWFLGERTSIVGFLQELDELLEEEELEEEHELLEEELEDEEELELLEEDLHFLLRMQLICLFLAS